MFWEIRGIPAHPLLLHAAVVFIPLLALGSITYTALPFLRSKIRWAVGLLAIVAPLSALVTKLSGDALRQQLVDNGGAGGDFLVKIDNHRAFGNITLWVTIALGVVVLVLLVFTTRVFTGTERLRAHYVVLTILGIATVGLALASLYYVFQAGDAGAHLKWG